MSFTVIAPCGTEKGGFESRSEAEDGADTHEALCEECGNGDCEIQQEQTETAAEKMESGGVEAEVVDHSPPAEPIEAEEYDLPDDGPSVDEDPLVWMPDEFTDTIDGTVAINRKGFEVLAHHYDIECQTEMVHHSEEKVIHKAEATDDAGRVYSAYGEADSSEVDSHQLVRMSDTRAYKRAVSRATGVGMIAVEELQNEL